MTRQRAAISLLVFEIVLAACTAAVGPVAEPSPRPAPEPRPVGVAAEPDAAARPIPQPTPSPGPAPSPTPTPTATPTRTPSLASPVVLTAEGAAACDPDINATATHLADALAKRREVWENVTAAGELMLYFGLAAVIIVEGTWAEENLTAEHLAWPPIAAYADRVAAESAAWEEILESAEVSDETILVGFNAFNDTERLETELRLLAHGCR